LIAIRVYADDEVDILSVVKINDIDIPMIYKILSEEEPHSRKSFVDVCCNPGVVFNIAIVLYE